jgi:hypothetical protein
MQASVRNAAKYHAAIIGIDDGKVGENLPPIKSCLNGRCRCYFRPWEISADRMRENHRGTTRTDLGGHAVTGSPRPWRAGAPPPSGDTLGRVAAGTAGQSGGVDAVAGAQRGGFCVAIESVEGLGRDAGGILGPRMARAGVCLMDGEGRLRNFESCGGARGTENRATPICSWCRKLPASSGCKSISSTPARAARSMRPLPLLRASAPMPSSLLPTYSSSAAACNLPP